MSIISTEGHQILDSTQGLLIKQYLCSYTNTLHMHDQHKTSNSSLSILTSVYTIIVGKTVASTCMDIKPTIHTCSAEVQLSIASYKNKISHRFNIFPMCNPDCWCQRLLLKLVAWTGKLVVVDLPVDILT